MEIGAATMEQCYRTVWKFLKKLKIELPYDPENPTPEHIHRMEENSNSKGYMHPNVQSSTIHNNREHGKNLNIYWQRNG